MIRAITFDYWDTLYEGGALPERVALRRTAVGALLGAYGRDLPEEQRWAARNGGAARSRRSAASSAGRPVRGMTG